MSASSLPWLTRRQAMWTLLATLCLTLPACAGGTAAYGTKVKFSEGAVLQFPDFTLTCNGRRRVTPPVYPRGWWAYDFTVAAKGKTQKISWSAGTGEIGPTRFTLGKTYDLELRGSRKFGWLKEDELVVTPVP